MEAIAKKLAELHPKIMEEFHRLNQGYCHEQDLPLVQLNILLVVQTEESCSLSEVSRTLNITPGWASENVEKLVQHGFLDRKTSKEDRRQVVLTLSENGKQFLLEVKRKGYEYFEHVLDVLEDKEQHKKLLEGFEVLHSIACVLKEKRELNQ
ncbi:MAG: MarR family winged helix-turn-helix transcriptional regulator [Candidatus Theseobacter exili]|nr:MarR family winged helix-turn-helix transcriptional regulator [Candidatus Theseobacter exili]